MSDIPEFSDLPAQAPGQPQANSFWDIWDTPSEPDVIEPLENNPRDIGYADELSDFWRFQGNTNDCGLYSQGGVLEADGQTFDIEKFRQQGMDGGWYTPQEGTYINHFGDLMEENGVEVTRYESASFQDMANELDQGHGVVVAVDCLPLWGQWGGHALWVTGMEVGEDGTPVSVICNDSGRPDGQEIAYPYEDFKMAWESYGNVMVATQDKLASLS